MQHGQKLEEMYDNTVPKNEVIYPFISIPAEVFKDEACQIGEEYRIEILIKIKTMDERSYGCDLVESEIEPEEKAKE